MAVTNGTFETGDTTGWTVAGAGSYTANVTEGSKRSGTYGIDLRGNPGGTIGWVTISQNIGTLTPASLLTIWCSKIESSGGPTQYKLTASGFDSDWQDFAGSLYGGYVETTVTVADLGITEETANVTLTIKVSANGDGYTEAYFDDISVGVGAPSASFTHATVGDHINFIDTSTPTPTSWLWDFGDGFTSAEQNPSHRFEVGTFTVSLTATDENGSDTATDSITVSLSDTFNTSIISTTVSKSMNDLMYHCAMEVAGHPTLPSQDIEVRMPDYLGNQQLVFLGYIPAPAYSSQEGNNKTTLNAYSYFWYLTKRYLPPLEDDFTGLQQTRFYNATAGEVTPTCAVYSKTKVAAGETVFIDPALWVREICETTGSVTKMGITLLTVSDSDEWNDGSLLNKDFGFVQDIVTRMDALQKVREYLGFNLREVFIDGVTPTDNLLWVPGDADDTTLQLPSKVTFTWPDPYVIGAVFGEDRSSEKYNSVRVRGYPIALEELFEGLVEGSNTLTLDQYGRPGCISGDLIMGTYTNEGGVWRWVYTVTAIDSADIIEHYPGGDSANGVDWVTVNDVPAVSPGAITAAVLLTYLPFNPYYEHEIKVAGVGTTVKEIEAPPIIDTDHSLGLTTQAKVTQYCSDYFDLVQTDPSVYHATLALRTDLREGQLVKFVGFNKIPEDDMRITDIKYSQGPGGVFVDIQCTLDRIFVLKRAMRDCTVMTERGLIERIVDKKINQATYETGATVVKTGDGSTLVQTDGGIYQQGPVT